ncbi:hypothetical protein [Brevibacterium spongiae]|uniref:Uncharacterized protein n=1 Tax=Brevibacterium spongiae TaxID=2909672 RepID=A0ABY5SUX6_9MICO|nr:hypothetical protein [Brevibacterium spongiae]UVI36514.1 hypothetical protein L1F31_02275 [Brevibacterium spongiae]
MSESDDACARDSTRLHVDVSDADAALSVGVVPVAMTEAPVEPVMPWAEETIDEFGGDDPELFHWSTEDTIPFEENTPDSWQSQAEWVSTVLDAKDQGDKAIDTAAVGS